MSWRQFDAQNVSFAIPSSYFTSLDLHKTVLRWNPAPRKQASPTAAEPVSARMSEGSPKPDPDIGDFAALKAELAKSAGQSVTVTLRRGDEEKEFAFEAPVDGF
jgi:hypothetical protein